MIGGSVCVLARLGGDCADISPEGVREARGGTPESAAGGGNGQKMKFIDRSVSCSEKEKKTWAFT